MIGTSAIGAAPLGGGGGPFVPVAPVRGAVVARPGGRGGRAVAAGEVPVRAAGAGEGARPARP